MKKSIEVLILNKKYSLITDESESILLEAASSVSNALAAVTLKGNVTIEKAAVLVALQLATEKIKHQEQGQAVNEQIERIITTLYEQQ